MFYLIRWFYRMSVGVSGSVELVSVIHLTDNREPISSFFVKNDFPFFPFV